MLKEEHKAFYDEIFPALDMYEDQRLKARKSTNALIILLVALFCAIGFFVLNYTKMALDNRLSIMLFLGFIFIGISKIFNKKYIKKFKRDVLVNLFSREGIKISHDAYKNIDGRHFAGSKMFKNVNSYSGTDLIKGEKNNLFFIASELKAFIKKDKSTKTIFEGIFLAGDLPHSFLGETSIYSKNFRYRYNKKIPPNSFNTLNSEFEYYFNVEYSNYDEASKLLMPAFMKRMIAFRKKHKHPFILKVVGSKVYLAINEDKDFFKVSIREKAYHQKNLKILSEDAAFFFDIVDLLLEIE